MSTEPKESAVYFPRYRTAYTALNIFPEVVFDYPQDWFEQNPGKKPPVVVPHTTLSRDALSRVVYKQFTSRMVPSSLIRAYLYDQLKEISEICPEDWRTFGVTIARKGDRVRIFDTLEIKYENLQIDDVKGVSKPNDELLLANILCICRMNTLSSEQAVSAAAHAITARFSRIYGSNPVVGLTQGKTNFKTWANDPELLKLLAAIDMFFFRFSNHSSAHYRLGTVVFRFMSCGAIESLLYVVSRKALEAPGELKKWMEIDCLASDMERLYKKDMSELENPYSYFPYSVSLGVNRRSPYSVTANPAVHAYCQTINVASGDVRGMNARLVMAPLMPNVIENGLETAYALGAGERPKIMEGDEEEGSLSTKREPKDRDPVKWYIFYRNGGKNSDKYREWEISVLNQITEVRKGSFGEYLKNYLTVRQASRSYLKC